MYRTIFASCVFTPGAHAYLAHQTSGVDYLEMSVRPDVRALLAAKARMLTQAVEQLDIDLI